MARDVVARKLDSLQRCLQRVQDRVPASVEALQADLDVQDVLTLNLTRAVQICVDLAMHLLATRDLPPPATMGEAFDQMQQTGMLDAMLARRMKQSVGFRNIAVHAYDSIDWHIVHAIASRHLEDFRDFARVIHTYMAEGGTGHQ